MTTSSLKQLRFKIKLWILARLCPKWRMLRYSFDPEPNIQTWRFIPCGDGHAWAILTVGKKQGTSQYVILSPTDDDYMEGTSQMDLVRAYPLSRIGSTGHVKGGTSIWWLLMAFGQIERRYRCAE